MDTRLRILQESLQLRPAERVERTPGRREAAVALLLRAREQIELLLIKRAEHEHDPWSGHMALPGGRRNPGDDDLIRTAYRETEEEVGVMLTRVGSYLGALDEVAPMTAHLPPLIIAPFVVAVLENVDTAVNPKEVDFAVWVPVPALREPGAIGELLVHFEGASHTTPSRRYGEHVIWGLTLRILEQLFAVLDETGL